MLTPKPKVWKVLKKVNLKPNPNRSPNANLMLTPKLKVWKVLKKVNLKRIS